MSNIVGKVVVCIVFLSNPYSLELLLNQRNHLCYSFCQVISTMEQVSSGLRLYTMHGCASSKMCFSVSWEFTSLKFMNFLNPVMIFRF